MAEPEGFSWTQRRSGDVVISHRGTIAAVLRGARAQRFVVAVEAENEQALMARLTGNYKRGNERRGSLRENGNR
jgi:hypothetical protein